jgi:type I site-specific restriction endonuclease
MVIDGSRRWKDICTKYITPAIKKTGWDIEEQIGEDLQVTKWRILVKHNGSSFLHRCN